MASQKADLLQLFAANEPFMNHIHADALLRKIVQLLGARPLRSERELFSLFSWAVQRVLVDPETELRHTIGVWWCSAKVGDPAPGRNCKAAYPRTSPSRRSSIPLRASCRALWRPGSCPPPPTNGTPRPSQTWSSPTRYSTCSPRHRFWRRSWPPYTAMWAASRPRPRSTPCRRWHEWASRPSSGRRPGPSRTVWLSTPRQGR